MPWTGGRLTDRYNPAAIRYAKMRLEALRRQGITPQQYGLGNLDPTAQWRALSSLVGARMAISSGHGASYQVPQHLPDQLRSLITNMLAAAATPEQTGSDTPQSRQSAPATQAGSSDVIERILAAGRSQPGRI